MTARAGGFFQHSLYGCYEEAGYTNKQIGVVTNEGLVDFVDNRYETYQSKKGVLNDDNIKGPKFPGTRWMSVASGLFKKVRPARPQPILSAERTRST